MMKTVALLILACLPFLCDGQTFKVEEFGAVADGKTPGTSAIQKAIDECSRHGGGRVLLSEGVYLSGAIQLKSSVTLEIQTGATLKAVERSGSLPPDPIENYQPYGCRSVESVHPCRFAVGHRPLWWGYHRRLRIGTLFSE